MLPMLLMSAASADIQEPCHLPAAPPCVWAWTVRADASGAITARTAVIFVCIFPLWASAEAAWTVVERALWSGNCNAHASSVCGSYDQNVPQTDTAASGCLRYVLLVGAFVLRPRILDIGEHGADLGIAEDIGKPWQVALVAVPHDRGGAFLHDPQQGVVGMVPRVAACIVRWCRETPGPKGCLPDRLPLELYTVAGRTLFSVELPALFDDI